MSSDRAIQPDYGMQFKTRPKLYEADWMMGCTLPDLWTAFKNIEIIIYHITQREYGRDNGRELSSLYK